MHGFMKTFLNKLLENVNNLQIFSLSDELDNLSLNDNRSSSSTSGFRKLISRYFSTSRKNSEWSQFISEKAPFFGIRRDIQNAISQDSSSSVQVSTSVQVSSSSTSALDSSTSSLELDIPDIGIVMGFRFFPRQSTDMLFNDFKFQNSGQTMNRLYHLKRTLGLAYRSRLPENTSVRSSVDGIPSTIFRSMTDTNKILVELLSMSSAHGISKVYRTFILVSIGIGCTVWYGHSSGMYDVGHGIFKTVDYNHFFDMNHQEIGFKKMNFVETVDNTIPVLSTFNNDPTFANVTIPASGIVLKAVGLSILIGVFITLGVIPDLTPDAIAQ
jgi:hypothetical protein